MFESSKSIVLDRIFNELPGLHRTNESTDYGFERSILPKSQKRYLQRLSGFQNFAISRDFAHYILGTIKTEMHTLETGSGVSTLAFALAGSTHIAVSPHSDETERILNYARSVSIDLSRATFTNAPSEQYLPTMDRLDLDAILIDGKHAFPWPMIDWFYTADMLKVGGILMLDDIQLRPVAVIRDFMKQDRARWKLEQTIERTAIFRKVGAPILDVAWHEHPWTVHWKRPFMEWARGRIKRHLGI